MEQIITFPGLGLKFQIKKVAFTIFGLPVYKYAICIVLAVIVALVLMRFRKKTYDIKFEDVLKCSIFTIIFGTIGARLYYVIFKMGYYVHHLGEIFDLKSGGLAIYGGIIAGIATIVIYCKKNKIDVLDMLDFISPYVVLGQAIGRWGNFFNGEVFGTPTKLFIGMGLETADGFQTVHPLFLYESILCLAIFVFLLVFQSRRRYKGQIFLYYMGLYAIVRFILESFRAESETLMVGNQRISQLVSAFIIITVFAYFYYRGRYIDKPNDTKEEVKK